ncbi:hypothetical protein THAOC_28972 [Thalassiosira oceanica]|uniref:Uncharacterized protein n=1 Tax=Thalassiosira oceanica TaxID=159749 RepID=K0RYT9_THAOC|nr:hypothetical protein THAOC_28972 [Thalassiosira oceanica]|eukprot:EJK51822.1 hypothetical protein THAOC_28972 [Thalassiosira oceanica]
MPSIPMALGQTSDLLRSPMINSQSYTLPCGRGTLGQPQQDPHKSFNSIFCKRPPALAIFYVPPTIPCTTTRLSKVSLGARKFAHAPQCKCGATFDIYGHHALSCPRNSKKGAHNMIRDGTQCFLCPALREANYMLPGDEIETEKKGICPSNCNIKPFDASFPPRLHSCHCNNIGFDYTLSPPPPPSSIGPTTDIQQQLSANAERCHQWAERAKYRRGGDTVDDADLSLPDPPSSKDLGELYIGEINRANRLLLPVSIGPYGDFGPIFRNFLFGQGPRQPLSPFKDRPQANLAHLCATSHPAPFTSSPQHAPTGSATSPDISLAILTRHPPHVNISSRSLGSTPQKPSPSCSTTHSSTSSAPRPASRPPIGPRPGPTTAPHTFHRYSRAAAASRQTTWAGGHVHSPLVPVHPPQEETGRPCPLSFSIRPSTNKGAKVFHAG